MKIIEKYKREIEKGTISEELRELIETYNLKQLEKEKNILDSVENVIKFLRSSITDKNREQFTIILLNSKLELLKVEKLFVGTVSSAKINFRELAKVALNEGATGVIVAHNHPSGSIQPSEGDLRTTKVLREGFNFLDIKLLDHIIYNNDNLKYYSFLEEGLM